jgi:hypothetical protein
MHLWRGIHGSRFLSAVFALAGVAALALAVGFGKATPAAQAGYTSTGPVTVKITQNAQYISSVQINVVVTLSCSAGAAYFVSVDVQQPSGFGSTTFGNGSASGQCTGKQQKVPVPVYAYYPYFGTWQLGDAVATATACTGACGSDTKQIHIVA